MKFTTSARIALSLCILLVLAPSSRNEPNHRRDGNWWRELSAAEKAIYTTGFGDGVHLGNNFSYWGFAKDDDATRNKVFDSFTQYGNKYMSHITNLQISDGLDSFYSDFKNRRIKISSAAWVVLRQIAGDSDAEIQHLIQNERKYAAEN